MEIATHPKTVRYRVSGMDCPSCAAKIEAAARAVPGVSKVRVSLTAQELEADVDGNLIARPLEAAVTKIGYGLNSLPADIPAHLSPAYRRALWVVILLNVGYGIIEVVAGFVADSQALQADALDFLGDGSITLLGLLAINWRPHWRAMSALLQGLFLGALGLAVFAATAYRVIVLNQPEAELMGAFGAMALVVNMAAAAALLKYRQGDTNVRAVWLFSRNDALGNAAVVIAALLVAVTGTPWPDLAVAFIMAALFLHSAWSIVADARRELRRQSQ